MIVFPNAKINLGLHVLYKRSDGYHQIDSCFYPIGWCDILEIVPASTFEFINTGLSIEGEQESNLCVKAYRLMQEKYGIPFVRIHLHKMIPMGGGLGGGSADGAFTIKMLNELFSLHLSIAEQQMLASLLGSDCPFFIENQPAIVSGRGDVLRTIQTFLKDYWLVVVNPHLHISTKEAYSLITPHISTYTCEEIIGMPIAEWKTHLKNDFETSVFLKYPVLQSIKEYLYQEGALYASMTGSGSSLYGIFKQSVELSFPSDYAVWQGYLL